MNSAQLPMRFTVSIRNAVAALSVLAVLWFSAAPAAAHTGFESSTPADGDVVSEPLSEITLTFSGEASPVGGGFVILDSNGSIRSPDEVTSPDNLTWTLRFDDPLSGGEVGVRWSVAAPDAHPIEGSFSFTVLAQPPVPTSEAGNDSVDQSSVPPATAEDAFPNSEPTATQAPVESTTTDGLTEAPPSATGVPSVDTVDLETFLNTGTPGATGAQAISALARVATLLGAVVTVGGAVFAALVLRGHHRDIRAVLVWVRRSAVLLVLGAVAEGAAQLAISDGSWSGLWSWSVVADTLWSSFGLAMAMRIGGGVVVASLARFTTRAATAKSDPVVVVKHLANVGAGPGIASTRLDPTNTEPYVHVGDEAWHPTASPAALTGIAVIVLSFLFDGHTVSEGPRWLHAMANVVHVATAATWAGGVVMLAFVVARRRRIGADTRSLQLASRFSVVASIALVSAGIAGTVVSIVILDSISQIWSTSWGRLLIAKVALVAIAAACGAYNHKIVVPALESSSQDSDVLRRFRNMVTVEAVILVVVAIVSALLIGASVT